MMVLVENSNVTLWSNTVVETKPIFFSGAPLWLGKNVTMLVAPVEQSSQELCDLYRKASNLDVKTVSVGGHNNHIQKSIQCVVFFFFTKAVCNYD